MQAPGTDAATHEALDADPATTQKLITAGLLLRALQQHGVVDASGAPVFSAGTPRQALTRQLADSLPAPLARCHAGSVLAAGQTCIKKHAAWFDEFPAASARSERVICSARSDASDAGRTTLCSSSARDGAAPQAAPPLDDAALLDSLLDF